MAKRSSTKWDNLRDKRYSAYVYIGQGQFRKSQCLKRGEKTDKCYEWKHHVLDQSIKEDEEFIKNSMILIPESEL